MEKFIKDPDSTLDYTWDWSDFLELAETIKDCEIVFSKTGLVLDQTINDDKTVTVWLSGGILNNYYYVTCRITTNQTPRTYDRSIYIMVMER